MANSEFYHKDTEAQRLPKAARTQRAGCSPTHSNAEARRRRVESKTIRVSVLDADLDPRKRTKAKSLEMRRCELSGHVFATLNLTGKTSSAEHGSC